MTIQFLYENLRNVDGYNVYLSVRNNRLSTHFVSNELQLHLIIIKKLIIKLTNRKTNNFYKKFYKIIPI
jgi:hypothetical protein